MVNYLFVFFKYNNNVGRGNENINQRMEKNLSRLLSDKNEDKMFP